MTDQNELTRTDQNESTTVSPVSKKRDALIGTVVAARYELISLLGRGATTSVYKAEDKEKKRFVALKILRTDSMFNEQLISRFEQECKTLALLKHLNIVQLYDHGVTESDQPFLVMEFVDGTSLKELIETDNRVDIKRSLKMFIQICAALAAAHEKGIVHRDMKPANIMLTKDANGEEIVKLLDFGVAKLLVQGETFQTKTQTGEMLGTLLYMSPEQCLEQVLDERCDVYSVGCVLYETLTGKPPLIGRTAFETMNKHLTEMPEKLAKVRPDRNFDPRLDAVIRIAMAKDPKDRYQRIGELQTALLAILANIGDESSVDKSSAPSLIETQVPATVSPPAVIYEDESSPKILQNVGLVIGLLCSLVAAVQTPIYLALSIVFLVALFVNCAEEETPIITSLVSQQERVTTDDSSRAGTVYFLAMEAVDGANWRTIYANQFAQYGIKESEVIELKTRLIAARYSAWHEVKTFVMDRFDELDKDLDGFISKAELIEAKASKNPRLREYELLSFLIKNMDDIQTVAHKGEYSDKGVRRQDLADYFLQLQQYKERMKP